MPVIFKITNLIESHLIRISIETFLVLAFDSYKLFAEAKNVTDIIDVRMSQREASMRFVILKITDTSQIKRCYHCDAT